MHQLDQILSEVAGYHPNADLPLVRRAYQFAAAGPRRPDPQVGRSLRHAPARGRADHRRAQARRRLGLRRACSTTASRTPSATVEQLGELFGKEIAFLVDGVTKLGKIPYSTREERQAENFRKMLLAMARDIRVILIKLCDRLDNMRTLDHLPPEKQERIARETMEIYAPLANRLGIQWIKVELEDLAFKYLYPGEYEQLAADVAKTRAERLEYIDDVEKLIHKEMTENGVPCEVDGPRQAPVVDLPEDEAHAARRSRRSTTRSASASITDTQMHCYQALGVAHQSGRRSRAASRTTSRCPSRTCTSRCTPR